MKLFKELKQRYLERKELRQEKRALINKLNSLEEQKQLVLSKKEDARKVFYEVELYYSFETGDVYKKTQPTGDERRYMEKLLKRYDDQIWHLDKDIEKVTKQLEELRKN